MRRGAAHRRQHRQAANDVALAELNDLVTDRDGYRVRVVDGSELGSDQLDVDLGCPFLDAQSVPDLLARLLFCEQPENRQFALTKRRLRVASGLCLSDHGSYLGAPVQCLTRTDGEVSLFKTDHSQKGAGYGTARRPNWRPNSLKRP